MTLASSSSDGCGVRYVSTRAVQAERAVVRLVTEVAAVREAFGSVGHLLHERLVDPVPDEAALQARVGPDRVPVVDERRRTSCSSRGCTRT